MSRVIALSLALFLALSHGAHGQTSPETDAAAKNADTLLAALKIADIPEGRQVLSVAAWRPLYEIPVVLEYTTLYQGLFDTDVPGVSGYKRLLDMKVQSKGRTVLTARYILVSYKDPKANAWKVFDVRDISGTTVEQTIEFYRQRGQPSSYWLTLGGKLKEAQQAMIARNWSDKPDFQILQLITQQ